MAESAAATTMEVETSQPTETAAAAAVAAADETTEVETIGIRVIYAKKTHKINFPLDKTIGDLKTLIAELTDCPAGNQKLMYKGLLAGPDKPELDAPTLREKKITPNAKILCVGATIAQIVRITEVDTKAKKGEIKADDNAGAAGGGSVAAQKWSEMPMHKKVLDKGEPQDVTFAYYPGQDQLPQEGPIILYDQGRNKVRMWVKVDQGTLVIGTKEATRKFPLDKIHSIKTQPIPGKQQFHILSIQTGPTEKSAIYLYWMPAQYVSALKGAVATFSPYA